jgi:hypothetical protein
VIEPSPPDQALQRCAVFGAKPYRDVVLLLAVTEFAGLDSVDGRSDRGCHLRRVETECRCAFAVDADTQFGPACVQIVTDIHQTRDCARISRLKQDLLDFRGDPLDLGEFFPGNLNIDRCSRGGAV